MTKPTHDPLAITGYRSLSASEIDLINDVKQHAARTQGLLEMIRSHLRTQANDVDAGMPGTNAEQMRLQIAQPLRWASIAETNLQQGFMALVRAIAQPSTF